MLISCFWERKKKGGGPRKYLDLPLVVFANWFEGIQVSVTSSPCGSTGGRLPCMTLSKATKIYKELGRRQSILRYFFLVFLYVLFPLYLLSIYPERKLKV